MARRFFVEKTNINRNELTIDGKEHLHLSKVLRAKINDEISISSKDMEYMCVIKSIEKSKTICKILSKEKIVDKSPNITLFQASMKGEHMEYAIQKATEIGIKTFVPFLSEFVVAKIDDKKIERFKKISQEACKQSGRKQPMDVLGVKNFKEMLLSLKDYDKIIFAYEKSTVSAKDVLFGLKETDNIALIVGSEGGFSEKEAKELVSCNAKDISLGENILRGETACLVLSSVVMYELGKFEKIWK